MHCLLVFKMQTTVLEVLQLCYIHQQLVDVSHTCPNVKMLKINTPSVKPGIWQTVYVWSNRNIGHATFHLLPYIFWQQYVIDVKTPHTNSKCFLLERHILNFHQDFQKTPIGFLVRPLTHRVGKFTHLNSLWTPNVFTNKMYIYLGRSQQFKTLTSTPRDNK